MSENRRERRLAIAHLLRVQRMPARAEIALERPFRLIGGEGFVGFIDRQRATAIMHRARADIVEHRQDVVVDAVVQQRERMRDRLETVRLARAPKRHEPRQRRRQMLPVERERPERVHQPFRRLREHAVHGDGRALRHRDAARVAMRRAIAFEIAIDRRSRSRHRAARPTHTPARRCPRRSRRRPPCLHPPRS